MYDIIGDIHGHADELVALLELLGYRRQSGIFRHASRQLIFVGDFIDRGPQIAQVLEIVEPMVTSGSALAVMGNHEFNALAFHTPDPQKPGKFLWCRSEKNIRQHCATLTQLPDKQLRPYLSWFRTLPLWLDRDGLRVVHACWDDELLAVIKGSYQADEAVSDWFLQQACDRGTPLFRAVDAVLKGKEVKLPNGVTCTDKDGHERDSIRAKWYESADGQDYANYTLQTDTVACDLPLPESASKAARPYPLDAEQLFVGHYWLSADVPKLLAPNVACVDYSVAKDGMLCAYRWDGEQRLDNSKFVTVAAR